MPKAADVTQKEMKARWAEAARGSGVKFIIVDRDTRRFKKENHFKFQFEAFREKMDISDFDLR